MKKINVAIVGLGFGKEFIPIYQEHPFAKLYAISDSNSEWLDKVGDSYGVEKRFTSFEELLEDDLVDAVHIATPIDLHASQSIAALRAGKHVACAVPMARTIEECIQIFKAQKISGKNYMMMETAVYTREFLYIKELKDNGKLGKIQFLRGSHHQNMEGWPEYWQGLPPMHYATHAIGPLLSLAQSEADYVVCFGSGNISNRLREKYGSPFAVESALIKIKNSNLTAEVTRSLFEVSREYIESFDIYCKNISFEWQRLENDQPVLFSGEIGKRIEVQDYAHLLPNSIQRFTRKGPYSNDEEGSFIVGGGHGGSHPHMVHEFILSILEERDPYPNVLQSANWTAVGICAHKSAMKNGEIIKIPDFIELL